MPAYEHAARRTLFDALEQALPVRFEGRAAGEYAGLDAALLLPGAASEADSAPVPCLAMLADEVVADDAAARASHRFAAGPRIGLTVRPPLDTRLRGARLRDITLEQSAPLPASASDVVLAARGEDPVWLSRRTVRGPRELVAVAPIELTAEECLRDRLRDGRFLAVAALLHFLRTVSQDVAWRAPPLRACFLFDDPNLHWPSYGYLRYQELVREADRLDYHVAFATIPIDGWLVHPGAARLFRGRPDRLSLVVHGNDHRRLELARRPAKAEARALLAQALRRIGAFERRSGVPVGRIMVAPHGVCSREVANHLVPLGFEALCINRPYSWHARPPRSWLARPPGTSPLVGWFSSSVVENGLPVLLRRAFDDPVEDLALRAFLDQPLIMYGHHGDMEGGLDRLAELAGTLRGLGDVQWQSLRDIAASNVTTRRHGNALHVRMLTRRVRLVVPDGVEHIAVETPSLNGHTGGDAIAWSAESDDAGGTGWKGLVPAGPSENHVTLPDAAQAVELRLLRTGVPDLGAIRDSATRPGAIIRRSLTEARDRLTPLYRRRPKPTA